MGEDFIRGSFADHSGWITTKVAAQALGIDPRTVRKYIKQGKLVAKIEGEGVEKTYLVSIDSVYALRDTRSSPRTGRTESPRGSADTALSEDLVALVRDLTSEISRRSSEAADLRARLELTELAETSRREVLEQSLETERLLRAQAERERDELRRELEALTETPQAPETASEPRSDTDTPESTSEDTGGIEGIVTPADVGGVQAATQSTERRSWWRRFFGFE